MVTVQGIVGELDVMGRWGTGPIRRLLADRSRRVRPHRERAGGAVLDCVSKAGLPAPAKQVVLGDELPIGRVDFVYEQSRLVIELDGRRWHEALLDAERDKVRDARLTANGRRPMRVTWRRLKRQRREAIGLIAKAIGGQLPRSAS
jgi:very-short-patch-repair endonuclease